MRMWPASAFRDPSPKLPGLTSAHAALGSLVSGVRCLLLPSARSEDLNSPTTACVFVCNLDFNWKHTHRHTRTLGLSLSLSLALSRVVSLRSLRTDLGREFNLPAP